MKRILVVDDEPGVRGLVTELFQKQYSVTAASNGAEAMDSIRRQVPDAVVLDMMMPVMDGWAVLAELRRHPAWSGLPVVVVSADPAACAEGKRLGARMCIPKPFDVEQLFTAVDQLVTGQDLR